MREIRIETNKLKLNLPDGEEILSFPSLKQRRVFDADLKKSDDDGKIDVFKDFLCGLGMTENTFDMLEMGHMQDILEEFNKSPK